LRPHSTSTGGDQDNDTLLHHHPADINLEMEADDGDNAVDGNVARRAQLVRLF